MVDTTADSLVIQTWVEGAGGVYEFWTPSATPLTFQAYFARSFPTTFASLTAFDVSDSWDGTIGSNWGFLSDLTKEEIAWNEGVFTGNSSRLGWGLAQANDESISSSFGTSSEFSFIPRAADLNTVAKADSVDITAAPISAVPVPAAVWLFGTGLIGLVGFSKRRKAA
jgi:hypothetical protein